MKSPNREVAEPGLTLDLESWAAPRGFVGPRGWEPVAEVCARVTGRLEAVSETSTDHIWGLVPYYASMGVPRRDLYLSVLRNFEMLLAGLAQQRGPSDEEVEVRRRLGRRRALQGMPIEAVLQAYHIGYRDLWEELVGEAAGADRAASHRLLSGAAIFWNWIHQVTEAVAAAHREASAGREAAALGRRQRFGELLLWGDLESPELDALVSTFGFDRAEMFIGAAIGGQTLSASIVNFKLDGLPGPRLVVERGPFLLGIFQGIEPVALERELRSAAPDEPIGIGVPRSGLLGARLSAGDAERALALVSAGVTLRFEDVWVTASLAADWQRLGPMVENALAVTRSHPILAKSVRRYVECGFSISKAARRLWVHPNTLTYRLTRWAQLTGWDPRTADGVIKSAVFLDVTARSDAEPPVLGLASTPAKTRTPGTRGK